MNTKKKVIFVFAFILLCLLGFLLGSLFANLFLPSQSTQTESKAIQTVKKNINTSKEPKKQNDNSKEEKMLLEIKNKLTEDFSKKYPNSELSFVIKNLDTGAKITYNNKQMNSASIIKLFIMETVFDQISQDKYTLSDEKAELLKIMITESNNNAANVFIDDFGGVNEKRRVPEDNIINATITAKGYKHTQLNRKMHDTTPPEGPSGYENYTSAEDVALLLEKIYNKTLLSEPYNTRALGYLKNQTRRAKIPDGISKKYPQITVANKTGELSQVENDAALIMCDKFNLVFVVMVNDIPYLENGNTNYALKEDVQKTISEFGVVIVDYYMNKDY